ncbi:MAG: hypothetical protein RR139_02850 [Lachnospiraceae bacterium]
MNGKQRYEEFIKEHQSTLRMGTLIWTCLGVIGIFLIMKPIGIIVEIAAVMLGILNVKSWIKLNRTLDMVPDKQKFYQQMEKPKATFLKFKIIVLEDYVLTNDSNVELFPLKTIEKIDVGVQKTGYKPKKCLFLTTTDGLQHKIALVYENQTVAALEEFDEIYQILNKK